MNSLRELTRSQAKQCSFKQWSTARKIVSFPISIRQIMNAYAPPKLWGFADLHAHPAAHIAFGADAEGNGRLFWGKPGLRLEDAVISMPLDLAPCIPDLHSNILDPKPIMQAKIRETVNAWGHCPPGCSQDKIVTAIEDAVAGLAQDPGTIWTTTFAAVTTVEHLLFEPFYEAAKAITITLASLGDPVAMAALASEDPLFAIMDLGLATAVASAVTAVVTDPNLDPVKLMTRKQIVDGAEKWSENANQTYEGKVYFHHAAGGWPDFDSWPNASSLLHQQMHISWIYRAWRGGLRLMIANAVDNQLFARLWNLESIPSPTWPEVDPNFDFNSAATQLSFIRSFVAANSSWMQIVLTSAEARSAVANNKLAVILGVEMDSLTVEQILKLKNEFGVRHVVPIHLANNDSFGGVAVHDDLFNTNNWYLCGGKSFWWNHDPQCDKFLKVDASEYVGFKLDPLQTQYLEASYSPLGAIVPTKVTTDDKSQAYKELDYAKGSPGQINKLGLAGFGKNSGSPDSPNFRKLMKEGLLIDVAHMSSNSQDNAIEITEYYSYPLMNSHSGLRPNEKVQGDSKTSERDMRKDMVGRLAGAGGVFGLGTSGYREEKQNAPGKIRVVVPVDQMERWIQLYWDTWNAMHFRGCAIGTDANGFSTMIPSSSKKFIYPFTVQTPLGPQEFPNSVAGLKTFDFQNDGIAHYGMLVDFVQALRQFDDMGGADIADYLLPRTAEDTINMWEKVERAATKIP